MIRVLLFCLSLLTPMLTTLFTVPALAQPANPQVLLKTSEGDITLQLFADKAPVTVANFLGYVDSGFYKGTVSPRTWWRKRPASRL